MAPQTHVLFLQLNELNFPYVKHYADRGLLPNFKSFFDRHGFVETESETEHHLANPWIQWPTVHTGLDYKDHGVFRLGDIVDTDHEMIYEALEKNGVSVAAMAAFNAKNTTQNAAFFVPDPWTHTRVDGPKSIRRIYDALCQVTDDYAKDRIALQSLINLGLGGLVNMQWKSLPSYMGETLSYLQGHKWMRAVVCDRLLGDAFLTQCKKHKPHFATAFLNASAHLEHHYLFSSDAYDGDRSNPEWHVPKGRDPLLDVLKHYDQLLADTQRFANTLPGGRVVLATGLHQDPHERETYYYRLDDHETFINQMGIEYKDTYRLMTEDFVLVFEDEAAAAAGERMLHEIHTTEMEDLFYVETADKAVRTMNTGPQVFHTENRGDSIYVQLKPSARSFPAGMKVRRGNMEIGGFDKLTSMAQYKNTHHHGLGYYSDSAFKAGELPERFPLRDLFGLFLEAFGIDSDRQARMDPDLLRALRGNDLASGRAPGYVPAANPEVAVEGKLAAAVQA